MTYLAGLTPADGVARIILIQAHEQLSTPSADQRAAHLAQPAPTTSTGTTPAANDYDARSEPHQLAAGKASSCPDSIAAAAPTG